MKPNKEIIEVLKNPDPKDIEIITLKSSIDQLNMLVKEKEDEYDRGYDEAMKYVLVIDKNWKKRIKEVIEGIPEYKKPKGDEQYDLEIYQRLIQQYQSDMKKKYNLI